MIRMETILMETILMETTEMEDIRQRLMEIQGSLNTRYDNDHDLLIELRTTMVSMARDVHDLKTGTVVQLQAMEIRVRALEASKWMLLGVASAFGAIAGWAVQMFSHR